MHSHEANHVQISRLVGYSLVVNQLDDVTVSRVTDVVHRHIPEAQLGRSHGRELNYTLPLSSVAQFAGACSRWQVRVMCDRFVYFASC